MAVYLDNRLLLNLLIAVLFRESGYIAGVPRRMLYGCSAGHLIPVIGIERSISPFNFHNIIVPFMLCSNKHKEQMEILYKICAVINDLEQSLPKKSEVLPDLFKGSEGEFFHKKFGNANCEQENISVQYKGIIFTNKYLNENVLKYANSKGIFIVYLPVILGGKDIDDWLSIIKLELNGALKNNLINISALKSHTRKQKDYKSVLHKIRKKDKELKPEELHDLMTILYALLREKSLRPLLIHIRNMSIISLNNYPVISEIRNVSVKGLIEGCAEYYLESINKLRGKGKSLMDRLGFLGEVNELSEKYLYRVTCYLDKNYYNTEISSLNKMKLVIYLNKDRLDFLRHNKACIRINIKEGLSLIGDIYLLN